MDVLSALYFGETSDLYKKLVVSEQKADRLMVEAPSGVDPSLFTVFARVKDPADAVYVRDQILSAFAQSRSVPVTRQRLDDAKFFPDPNIARRRQMFEIWIRPVVPVNAHMTLRIALYELGKLIDTGLSQQQFEQTRDYLMKNVFVMTARQGQQLGYALDSRWFGIGEFTQFMRRAAECLDGGRGERRRHAPSHREGSLDRHRDEGCGGAETGAGQRRTVANPLRWRQAGGAARRGSRDRRAQVEHRAGSHRHCADRRGVRQVSRT